MESFGKFMSYLIGTLLFVGTPLSWQYVGWYGPEWLQLIEKGEPRVGPGFFVATLVACLIYVLIIMDLDDQKGRK